MNEMKTGNMPSVSSDLNVGADRKKTIMVDADEMMLQSGSRSRGGRMDLGDGMVNTNPERLPGDFCEAD